ncbi:hypothetical protein H0176_23755 [Methylorubrum populi]|uniref:Uncharacterized protein n=1 Tax=Methylorubrum rhodesianum TaxID=29427 RepID=A0ABU9ZD45_9HYPH|nr:hypothetical protein [Methylorubrum rhodesianum]MBK3406246.1 hypothetical protein [Methylorubrum rhodesianum]MBY0143260.1 hypothetical protein [Methylorubrum populi]
MEIKSSVENMRIAARILQDDGHAGPSLHMVRAISDMLRYEKALEEIVALRAEQKSDKYKKDRAALIASQALRTLHREDVKSAAERLRAEIAEKGLLYGAGSPLDSGALDQSPTSSAEAPTPALNREEADRHG